MNSALLKSLSARWTQGILTRITPANSLLGQGGSALPWLLVPCLISVLLVESSAFGAWEAAKGPLATRWAKEVSPEKAHPEYPRPQLVRADWLNLNGLWDYAIRATNAVALGKLPETYDGQILVPFPVESALSGVMKQVGSSNRLWYRRVFTLPANWTNKQVLLNFGAIDWEATVYVNGNEVDMHRGGYDGFIF